jgi:hypothetical protein
MLKGPEDRVATGAGVNTGFETNWVTLFIEEIPETA